MSYYTVLYYIIIYCIVVYSLPVYELHTSIYIYIYCIIHTVQYPKPLKQPRLERLLNQMEAVLRRAV